MEININHYYHRRPVWLENLFLELGLINNALLECLDELKELKRLVRKEDKTMAELSQEMQELVAAVAENTQIDASGVQAINGLAAKVEALSEQIANMPPAEQKEVILALAAEIRAASQPLGAAIATVPADPPAPA